MRPFALVALLAAGACASGPRMWTPAARLGAASCDAPGAPAGPPWRLVQGAGFTFCVPADWTPAGSNAWQGGGGSISWGTGEPPRGPVISGSVTVTMPVGSASAGDFDRSQARAEAEAQMEQRCSVNNSTETIGGAAARVHDTECDGKHDTGAYWQAAAIYLQGKANDFGAAWLQLMIYRTVRFGPAG